MNVGFSFLFSITFLLAAAPVHSQDTWIRGVADEITGSLSYTEEVDVEGGNHQKFFDPIEALRLGTQILDGAERFPLTRNPSEFRNRTLQNAIQFGANQAIVLPSMALMQRGQRLGIPEITHMMAPGLGSINPNLGRVMQDRFGIGQPMTQDMMGSLLAKVEVLKQGKAQGLVDRYAPRFDMEAKMQPPTRMSKTDQLGMAPASSIGRTIVRFVVDIASNIVADKVTEKPNDTQRFEELVRENEKLRAESEKKDKTIDEQKKEIESRDKKLEDQKTELEKKQETIESSEQKQEDLDNANRKLKEEVIRYCAPNKDDETKPEPPKKNGSQGYYPVDPDGGGNGGDPRPDPLARSTGNLENRINASRTYETSGASAGRSRPGRDTRPNLPSSLEERISRGRGGVTPPRSGGRP